MVSGWGLAKGHVCTIDIGELRFKGVRVVSGSCPGNAGRQFAKQEKHLAS